MSGLQKFLVTIFPESWARSMEADSRAWVARCACGHERSVWDMGGIRWKATRNSFSHTTCPACGVKRWRRLEKRAPSAVGAFPK